MIILNDLNLGLSISAFLVCMCNLLFTGLDRRVTKPQNKIYISMMMLHSASALCGIAAFLVEKNKLLSDSAFHTLELSRYIYFLTHSLLAPSFFCYISLVIGRSVNWKIHYSQFRTKRSLMLDVFLNASWLAMELIIILNPLLHWTWYFDNSRTFQREWGEIV